MSIVMNNVTFSYQIDHERKTILNHVQLHVEMGAIVGLCGASGGGKSTLLYCLSGLYAPDAGTINIHGGTSPKERQKNSAIVFQSPSLLPLTIEENITLGHDISKEKLHKALEDAQLTSWISSLPKGIHTILGEHGNTLSGGQGQRIALARAFAKDAPVLILDEATSALDSSTAQAVMNALHMLRTTKTTILLISHQKEILKQCDSTYELKGGNLHAL